MRGTMVSRVQKWTDAIWYRFFSPYRDWNPDMPRPWLAGLTTREYIDGAPVQNLTGEEFAKFVEMYEQAKLQAYVDWRVRNNLGG